MKRKLLATILALCLLIGCLPMAASAAEQYSVTLHFQDGSTADQVIQTTLDQHGRPCISLPQANRNGYAFLGWNNLEDGNGCWFAPRQSLDVSFFAYTDNSGRPVYESFTDLYAQWEPISTEHYLVYFNEDSYRQSLTQAPKVIEVSDSEMASGATILKTYQELGFSKTNSEGSSLSCFEWHWSTENGATNDFAFNYGNPGESIHLQENPYYIFPTLGYRKINIHSYNDMDGEWREFESYLPFEEPTESISYILPPIEIEGKIFLGYNSKEDGTGNWYSRTTKVGLILEDELWEQWVDEPTEDYVVFYGVDDQAQIVKKSDGGYICPEHTKAIPDGAFLGWGFSNYNMAGYDDGMSLQQLVIKDGNTALNPKATTLAYDSGTKLTWVDRGTHFYAVYARNKNEGGYMVPRVAFHPNGASFPYGAETYWLSYSLSNTTEFDSMLIDYTPETKIGVEYGGIDRPKLNLFQTVPSGKKFTGWNTKADGTGTQYPVETLSTNWISVTTQVLNLYAQWEDVSSNPAPNPSTPSTPSTPTTPDPVVTENPDGSTTTTETAEDGTVTATTAWNDGRQAVAVKSPEGEKTITVTTAAGEKVADVKLPAKPAEPKVFEDVKDDGWYKDAVDKATGYGLFNGTSDTKFSPDDGMTRAMLATVLHNLSGKPEYGTNENTFTDVTANAWYEDPVDWAYKVGVTSGTSDTEFSPDKDITREQLVTMLYRYAEKIGAASKSRKTITGFPDGNKVAGYAQDAMQWAVAEGFISGRAEGGKNYIAPQVTATRAEVAAVLTRFVEYLKK